jgi:proline iminopeptidase
VPVAGRGLTEGHLPVGGARLYYRALGEGWPIIVLHGGPDFDHNYLIPELDRLAESFSLVYYDQRGRGRSAEGVVPADVGIASEIEDLDAVRRHFGLDQVALLGHSWGGLLAMEYAVRHSSHVSHLILMNTGPATAEDWRALRAHFLRSRRPGEAERMRSIASSPSYEAGELAAESDYYRIHFAIAVEDGDVLEELIGRLHAHVTPETVVKARAIELRLYEQTCSLDGYDLLPQLRKLETPTLVLIGDKDFVPVELVAKIADAMPRGRLVVLEGCGHFPYLEAPEAVHEHVTTFLRGVAEG